MARLNPSSVGFIPIHENSRCEIAGTNSRKSTVASRKFLGDCRTTVNMMSDCANRL